MEQCITLKQISINLMIIIKYYQPEIYIYVQNSKEKPPLSVFFFNLNLAISFNSVSKKEFIKRQIRTHFRTMQFP